MQSRISFLTFWLAWEGALHNCRDVTDQNVWAHRHCCCKVSRACCRNVHVPLYVWCTPQLEQLVLQFCLPLRHVLSSCGVVCGVAAPMCTHGMALPGPL